MRGAGTVVFECEWHANTAIPMNRDFAALSSEIEAGTADERGYTRIEATVLEVKG